MALGVEEGIWWAFMCRLLSKGGEVSIPILSLQTGENKSQKF
jgi:hypothetical protein